MLVPFEGKDVRLEGFLSGEVLLNCDPLYSLNEHLGRAVGDSDHLKNGAQVPRSVQVLRKRIVHLHVLLGSHQDCLVLEHGHFNGLEGAGPSDEQGSNDPREDDDIPDGKDKTAAGRIHRSGHLLGGFSFFEGRQCSFFHHILGNGYCREIGLP